MSDYEAIRARLVESIAGGTISIPGGYGELARDDAENIVDAILGDAALSRAAAPDALHQAPAIKEAIDTLDYVSDRMDEFAYDEIRSAIESIPDCESATAMVHAEDHGAPEPEWEYGVTHVNPRNPVTITDSIQRAREARQFYDREIARRGGSGRSHLFRRTKAVPAGPWEPLPVGGESDGREV